MVCQRDLGIAGVVAGVLVTQGAAWAFGIGIGLCLLRGLELGRQLLVCSGLCEEFMSGQSQKHG